jgi:hypothetical protein
MANVRQDFRILRSAAYLQRSLHLALKATRILSFGENQNGFWGPLLGQRPSHPQVKRRAV